MLGKLDWSAVPFDEPIPLIVGAVVLVALLAVLAWVAAKGHLPYLWHEWITSGSASCTSCSPR
jgi:cytochrome o ubiquinol oxidase subunit 1